MPPLTPIWYNIEKRTNSCVIDMRVNPGGKIPSSEVIGRDRLIENLWRILDRQSLVLSAERRMGKTCIVKKMTEEAPEGILPIYRELEGVRSPLEFAQIVFDDVEKYLSGLGRTGGKVRELLKNLTGMEIGGIVKFPNEVASEWKILLTKTIEDLVIHQDRLVIFFWDEMPLMLDNIKTKHGETVAMEVLDTLRSLRQNYDKVRMVYTGSIGLHNVITALQRAGYKNAPTNDMYKKDVPPLSPADAKVLAMKLLVGEGIKTDNFEETSRAIASAADNIPYFIHHIIYDMLQQDEPIDATTPDKIVNNYLRDPEDPWDLYHYRVRIDNYYQQQEIPIALNLLDILAVASEPILFNDLYDRLQDRLPNSDIEQTRNVLLLIGRDHYVIQEENGYCFRYALIKSYWQLHRGLQE